MKFDSHAFFKLRLSAHLKELSRYLKYIFNGHTALALLFLIAAAAYYYQAWLSRLPENFPAALIIGVLFGLIVSYSPVRTLLKEADLFFLIPAEDKMNRYFRNAWIYSFVTQLYIVLLVAAALGPLYSAVYPDSTGSGYLWIVALMIIAKAANLLANWWMLKVREAAIRKTDIIVRTFINMAIFYFIVKGETLFAVITIILFFLLFLYEYFFSKKSAGIVWDLLVEKDQHRMQSFYRFANMFAEVPHLRNRVKNRSWLVSLATRKIPFTNEKTFDYLFRITFVRSGEYLGMYLRLLIIGAICIYLIPNIWVSLLFVILFLYLSLFQTMAIYYHHRTNIWLDLYPVSDTLKKQAAVKLLYQLGVIQTILFGVVFVLRGDFLGAGAALLAGFIFTYLFLQGYVSRKLN